MTDRARYHQKLLEQVAREEVEAARQLQAYAPMTALERTELQLAMDDLEWRIEVASVEAYL